MIPGVIVSREVHTTRVYLRCSMLYIPPGYTLGCSIAGIYHPGIPYGSTYGHIPPGYTFREAYRQIYTLWYTLREAYTEVYTLWYTLRYTLRKRIHLWYTLRYTLRREGVLLRIVLPLSLLTRP